MNPSKSKSQKNTNKKVQPSYSGRLSQKDEEKIEKKVQAEMEKLAESKAVAALCISIFILIISSVPIIIEITDPSTPADHGLRSGFSTLMLLIPDIAGVISVLRLSTFSLGRFRTEKSCRIGLIALIIAILVMPLYFIIMARLEPK